MKPATLALAVLAAAFAPPQADAASSQWERVEGGAVRIVVSGLPQPDGRLRAALEIELKPGWKTYWLDPGSSGVPPTVELAAAGAPVEVAMEMPAPQRFDEGYASFAGYAGPVAIALTLAPPEGWSGGTLDFKVFIGICETICIPVQAALAVEDGGGSPDDEAAVEAAFAALPAGPRPDLGIASAWVEGDELIVRTALPAGTREAELFVASTPSFAFGQPKPSADGQGFHVPLLDRPAGPVVETEAARYTLIADGEAVSGTFPVSGHP